MSVNMPEDQDHVVFAGDNEAPFRAYWWIAEDGDDGAMMGEMIPSATRCNAAQEKRTDDAEYFTAIMAMKSFALTKRDDRGFYWDTAANAGFAIDAANRAILAYRSGTKAEPEWAQTARAHGWKPPKDWKP